MLYVFHLALAWASVMFSLGLADRIHILRQEKERQELTSREAELRAQSAEEANRAKSQFLANMSHQIRTPMNAILGYAQLLRRATDLPPVHRQAVETIQNSGNHLLSLINEVLDISKIEAGRMELNRADFDLRALLQGLNVMFQLRCEQKRLNWRVETPADRELWVRGDEGKLSQVLINLLSNAVKFTEVGEVTLQVARREAHEYVFAVIDTGSGIAAEVEDAFPSGLDAPQSYWVFLAFLASPLDSHSRAPSKSAALNTTALRAAISCTCRLPMMARLNGRW